MMLRSDSPIISPGSAVRITLIDLGSISPGWRADEGEGEGEVKEGEGEREIKLG